MSQLKMLGLAAMMALLAMALVGTPPAMAEGETALCASEGEGAEEEKEEKEGCLAVEHVHETSVVKGKLLSSTTIECDVLYLGDMTAKGLEEIHPLVLEGKFTYTNCGSSCTVEEVSGSTIIKVLKEGHETASETGGNEIHISCPTINCYYSSQEIVGVRKGPLLSKQENGEVVINEKALKKVKGVLCPATAKLDLTTTPLEASYIINPGVILRFRCEQVPPLSGSYTAYPCRWYQSFPFGSWERKYY